jgi:hypothetical protein
MTNATADKILAQCATEWPASKTDCNQFVKAVAAYFFEPDLFTGAGMNADAIIGEMRTQATWTKLGTTHTSAISDAKAGKFVVAGMTSTEIGDTHGHLAVVVGDDGQNSGTVLVPICYAGSLSANGRVARKRVSETFRADDARESRISYFSRKVDTVPAARALDLLVDFLRRDELNTHVALIPAKPKKKKKKAGKRAKGGRGR